jgi:DNA repair exonuclease SbcCD ATPase subunit
VKTRTVVNEKKRRRRKGMKRSIISIAAALLIAMMFMACADEKGPAELAMQAAEQAVNAAKAEAVKFAPEKAAGLDAALASVKEKMAKKEYKEALAEAQTIPDKAKEVLTAAKAKKDELTKKWDELVQAVPPMVAALQTKVDELGQLKKLPKEMTAEKLAEAKAGLDAVKADWAKAEESFKAGNFSEALTAAGAIKEKATKQMEALGLSIAPVAPATPGTPAVPAAPTAPKAKS